ncbi:uncharacterized protein [Antedon mediterranea]|uniref:uncharacterized protein n=1 Tax=Antedon mediterranea TaxID=105859 RepID=UPI003AF8A1D1
MTRKLLCCTDNLSVLPVCGVFLGLLGIVLFILYLVVEDLTTSLEHIDGAVPVWVPAVLLLFTGISMILQSKKRPVGLLVVSLCLSIASAVVCVSVAVPTIMDTIPFMESLTLCVYQQSMAECRCYAVDSKQNGTNLISIPEGSKQYIFKEVKGCDTVERTLKDILFTESVIYCFGAVASILATVLTSLLLCHKRKSNKSPPVQDLNSDAFENPNTHRFHYNNSNRLFLHGPGQTYIVGLGRENQDRSALINSEVVPNVERTTSTTNTTTTTRNSLTLPGYGQSQNSAQRTASVRRSSSTSSAALPRPVVGSRHHSISTADNVATRRPGRPPPLIRGGFMQSHPDGRAVPVYTIPGSNQAYISLNDLPSLQMPNMDNVPAYIPQMASLNSMQGPYPSEEPPPYSPSAEYQNNEVPPIFPATALTTLNETSESALSSPLRSIPDVVNTAVPVDNVQHQTSPDVTVNDVSVEVPHTDITLNVELPHTDITSNRNVEIPHDNDNSHPQETINESILNENFTFSSGSGQSPRTFHDITSASVYSNSSVDDDYDLSNITDCRPTEEDNSNNLSLKYSEPVNVSRLSSASKQKWNLGTSSRESLSATLACLPQESIAGTSRTSSVDNLDDVPSVYREQSNETMLKSLPKGARPKVKPKPGRQRKRKKNSDLRASSTSRLLDAEYNSAKESNPVVIDSSDGDATNYRSRTKSLPNLTKQQSGNNIEITSDNPIQTEMSKPGWQDRPTPWAFDVGTVDGRRKKNKHRNTTAFYDLIERANNYQRKEEKPPQDKPRKQENNNNNRRNRNKQSSGYNRNHTNPRQKAKIRTDLPASSAWGPKKNIPSISGQWASKSAKRPQIITQTAAETHMNNLSSSSNESLTDVISLVANTSTSSTRARKKRVMLEAESITELLDTRV